MSRLPPLCDQAVIGRNSKYRPDLETNDSQRVLHGEVDYLRSLGIAGAIAGPNPTVLSEDMSVGANVHLCERRQDPSRFRSRKPRIT